MLERLPYFKFFIADYLLDTRALTQEEHGAYTLLIANYYWDGGLPIDRAKLHELACADNDTRRAAADKIIERYFHVSGERLIHNRIERELQKLGGIHQKRSEAGRASAEARTKKPRARAQHKANGASGFEQFYAAYPRKVKREAAENAWKKLAPDETLQALMLGALERQRPQWTDPKFIPYPASWLNGKRWEDEAQEQDAVRRNPDGSRKVAL